VIALRDDGWCRTHDEAEAALRGECDRLGARLFVYRTGQGERFRGYTVTLERWGQRPLSQASTYGVPCPADSLLGHVRTMVVGAASAAEKERVR
jgi:hypothetical protein